MMAQIAEMPVSTVHNGYRRHATLPHKKGHETSPRIQTFYTFSLDIQETLIQTIKSDFC
jgi:hypothetical protein